MESTGACVTCMEIKCGEWCLDNRRMLLVLIRPMLGASQCMWQFAYKPCAVDVDELRLMPHSSRLFLNVLKKKKNSFHEKGVCPLSGLWMAFEDSVFRVPEENDSLPGALSCSGDPAVL